MSDLRCDDVLTLWNDQACGQAVSAAERAAVDQHLAGCESCRVDDRVAGMMSLDGAFGAAVFAPAGVTREAFVDRALELAEAPTVDAGKDSGIAPPARSPLSRPALVGLGIGLAAAVVLALGATAIFWVSGGEPSPEPEQPVPATAAEVAPQPQAAPLEQVAEVPQPQQIGTSKGKGRVPSTPAPKAGEATPKPMAKAGSPGTLSVNTKPWSEVWVDGEKIGMTPIVNRRLPPGSHTVKVRVPSTGVEKKYKVKIESGERTVIVKNLEDEPAVGSGRKGKLSVQTKPWSTVYINGKKIKNTPIVNYPLRPGVYRVTVENPTYDIRKSYKVKIESDSTTTLVEDLLK